MVSLDPLQKGIFITEIIMARMRSQLKVESGKLNVLCAFPSTLNSQLSTLNWAKPPQLSTLNSQKGVSMRFMVFKSSKQPSRNSRDNGRPYDVTELTRLITKAPGTPAVST